MTDFHSHILPGVDDGSKNTEMSLEMLRASREQGVKRIIATPHFYADSDDPERFLRRRNNSMEKLRAAMGEEELPEIILGAEVTYFDFMGECEELKKLTIEGTKMILVEMPMISWTPRMIKEIYKIYDNLGLIPIIAHIDRYIEIFRDKKIVTVFDEMPAVIQASASFFNERKTAGTAIRMLKKGNIHILGTDMHNMTTRVPNMKPCIDLIVRKAGKDTLQNLYDWENAVLSQSRRDVMHKLGFV